MSDDDEKKPTLERYIELAAGLAMWGWLMYEDHKKGIDLSDMSSYQIGYVVSKYSVAFILIRGVSMSQVGEFAKDIASIVKAWRGKG